MSRHFFFASPGEDKASGNVEPPNSLFLSTQPSADEVRACSQKKSDRTITSGQQVVDHGQLDVFGPAAVTLKGDAQAVGHGTAHLEGTENSVVCGRDQNSVGLADNATAFVRDSAKIDVALDFSNVFARGRGDIHNHSKGTVTATDARDVYLRSGTAYVSGDAAVEPDHSRPGDPVAAYAKDRAIVATYTRSNEKNAPPLVALKDKAMWLDYDNGKHTLKVTKADGTSRTLPAPEGSTLWIRDEHARKNHHQTASGDDVVVAIRTQKSNDGDIAPPAKLQGDALWIDIWPNDSSLFLNRAEDVHVQPKK